MKIIRKIVTAGVAPLAIGGMAAGMAATTASASSGPTIAAGPALYSHKTVAYGPWWLSNGMASGLGYTVPYKTLWFGVREQPSGQDIAPVFHVSHWTYYSRYSARADGTIYFWDTNGQHLSSASIHFFRAVHSPTSWGWYFTRIQLSADHGHITQSWYWDWHQPPGFWWILSHQTGGGF